MGRGSGDARGVMDRWDRVGDGAGLLELAELREGVLELAGPQSPALGASGDVDARPASAAPDQPPV